MIPKKLNTYAEYICVDAVGELIRPKYMTEHFQVLLKQNGLRRIRFQDLRHSTASLLLSKGVPMKMIQDWLGHSDMGTTRPPKILCKLLNKYFQSTKTARGSRN